MKKQILCFTAALILLFPLLVAAQQSFITGTVQGPDGVVIDGATIYVCTGLVKAEREAREGGKTRKSGTFKVRYPEGKQADLFAWKAGYEPLIRRDVSSPSELGVLKLPGTNDSAIVEKRNIESAQQAAQQKAKNRENERQRRQKTWEEHEKTYPNGVHLPLPGLRDSELIARENSLPRRIKVLVLTPSGQLLDDGNEKTVRVSFGENLQVEKYSPKKWFLINAIANGSFYGEGRIDVLAPHEKTWDICIWAKGYEPLLIRNVTAPSDLGTVKLTGPNQELEEVHHITK